MELVLERPPVAAQRHEVRGRVAGDGAAVDCAEGVVEDTLDLVRIRRERVEDARVRDERDDGCVSALGAFS